MGRSTKALGNDDDDDRDDRDDNNDDDDGDDGNDDDDGDDAFPVVVAIRGKAQTFGVFYSYNYI